MKNKEGANLMLGRAKAILEEAINMRTKGLWNLAVRRSQEAVKLALKSALVWAGIQPPRVHDVGPALRENAGMFPKEFAQYIPKLASISRTLRAERELSMYGDEESGVQPEALYSDEDAQNAIEKAKFVLEQCEKLLVGDR
ncbi:MAG: HEPN domain-containing protein [Candidatus Anstonellaceae archaeon]